MKTLKTIALTLFLAAVCASFAVAQTEHHGVSKSGTLGAPALVGPSITVNAEALSSTVSVNMYCPITDYGEDVVGIYWTCGDGELDISTSTTVKKVAVTYGDMRMSCYYPSGSSSPTCLYGFSGMTAYGPLQFTARGNQYIGTIYYFDGVW